MKNNPVVIITGASGATGRALALTFAQKGFAVAGADIDPVGLKDLESAWLPWYPEYASFAGDLQDPAFLLSLVESVCKKWERIDVLINNAAWRTLETLRTISIENWEKTIRVCLTAPAFLTKYVARQMEEKGTKGVIINIGSVQSSRAAGVSPAYAVCKAGLETLTYESAVLYGPKGIRAITVNPGQIMSSMSADYTNGKGNNMSKMLSHEMNDQTPLNRAADPQEIANVCYWLSSAEASFITGTSILVDGGFTHNFNSYEMKKLQFLAEF